jgi:sphingomyelin phosphodiesterase 3
MIASRYPILDVNFYSARHKNSFWQQAICYGIVMAKVDLGQNSDGQIVVGYISNLHNVAYQGEHDLIGPSMTEAQSEFNKFQKKSLKSGEKIAFAVICGDFNFDNISPGNKYWGVIWGVI